MEVRVLFATGTGTSTNVRTKGAKNTLSSVLQPELKRLRSFGVTQTCVDVLALSLPVSPSLSHPCVNCNSSQLITILG